MPRFFFHLRDPSGFIEDSEGLELASADAARGRAIEGIRSIIADEAKAGRIDLTGTLEVTDESGASLFALDFEEVIDLRRGDKPRS